jgi:hypothetical protein
MSTPVPLSELDAKLVPVTDDEVRYLRFTCPLHGDHDVKIAYWDKATKRVGNRLVHQRVDGPETIDGLTLIPGISIAKCGLRGSVRDGRWEPA